MQDLHNRIRSSSVDTEAYPAVRLHQKEDEAMLQTELPGIDPAAVNLHVQDDHLTLSFERSAENTGDGRALRIERPVGKYSRTVRLPFRIDAARVEAVFMKGVLSVRLPMVEDDKPRKIQVKAS